MTADALAPLLNFGGVGALAAVLLHLHREALKAFREELAEARRVWTESITKIAERLDRIEDALGRDREISCEDVRRVPERDTAKWRKPRAAAFGK